MIFSRFKLEGEFPQNNFQEFERELHRRFFNHVGHIFVCYNDKDSKIYVDIDRFIEQDERKLFEDFFVSFLREHALATVLVYTLTSRDQKNDTVAILSKDGIEDIDFTKIIEMKCSEKKRELSHD